MYKDFCFLSRMNDSSEWKRIIDDEFYSQFIDKGSPSKLKHEAVTKTIAVSEQLRKLTEGISLLDKELQKLVLTNHENLLSQATWVEKLETVLASMQTHVQCLLTSVEKLRNRIVEPFEKIEKQTIMLARLHSTSDLVRTVTQIQHICKQLNIEMQNSDLLKASQCLNELSFLSADLDLSRLEVLRNDLHISLNYRLQVEQQSKLILNKGLKTQNHDHIVLAIQILSNLHSLNGVVIGLLNSARSNITNSLKDGLDAHNLTHGNNSEIKSRAVGPGHATMPSMGSVGQFRTRLWATLEKLFNFIFEECQEIALLQVHLLKKVQDPDVIFYNENNLRYLDILSKEEQYEVENFWYSVTKVLGSELKSASQSSNFIKQALEGEYPKFLKLYLELCNKLKTIPQVPEKSEKNFLDLNKPKSDKIMHFSINREVIIQFENAYLSRSVSRLLDPVNLMFSGDTVPPHEEIDQLIKTISSELGVASVDQNLSSTVARNISKAVRLFCLKSEQMIATEGDATQVIDNCTPGQNLNVQIANDLGYLSSQINNVLVNMRSNLTQETVSIVIDSLSNTDRLIVNILSPLLLSFSDAIEAIILTMHNEDYGRENIDGFMGQRKVDFQCSLYMQELSEFMSRSYRTFLSPFNNQEIVAKCCLPVAVRCLELFLRHVCLVRPLGDAGRHKLGIDFNQMEHALQPLCRQLSELGRPYRLLRSFRPLLFLQNEDIPKCPALGDIIPYSMALLCMFSRAPLELKSPHQTANWSISRFSQWLDSHKSEKERLEMINGALQCYAQTVRQAGATNYHPVYYTMLTLLEKGLQTCV